MNETTSIKDQQCLRVGIYLRLSDEDTDKQKKEDDSESIKNQRNLLLEAIDKTPEFMLVEEYCDEDLSGAGTYRPEFERLIKDCEMGKLDIVLCKSQSRFSRDMEIIEKYLHNKFLEWKIRFIGLSDNADTANAGNKKSRQINGLVNEWYLEDVSNNIRSAFYSKMKQGEFISPFAPYGYEILEENNNKLVIDPIASENVKDIFDLYLSGLGFTGIAKHLNNKNIPCPSRYKYQKGIKLNVISNRPREEIKWTTNAIKTILTNEVYLGHLIQGKRTTVSYKNHKIRRKPKQEWIRKENTHESIIDEDTFKCVQNALKERTKPIKNTDRVHNFSGKVFCLECGKKLRKKNNSKGLQYLSCSSNQDGYMNCSNKHLMRYDVLEEIILKKINEKIKKFIDIKRLRQEEENNLKYRYNDKIKSLEKQKKELENQINKTTNYLKHLYEDKVNDVITEEQFKFLSEEYNQSAKKDNIQIKKLSCEIEFYKVKQQSNIVNEKMIKKLQLEKLNRLMIEELIEKIYIGKVDETNTRSIQIKWNF